MDWKTDARVFWADIQRAFMFPLMIIFAVYFFVRLNALDKHVAEHHAMPGHMEAIRIATEAKARAENIDARLDRLEKIVNHVLTNLIPRK